MFYDLWISLSVFFRFPGSGRRESPPLFVDHSVIIIAYTAPETTEIMDRVHKNMTPPQTVDHSGVFGIIWGHDPDF
jgi:hypothetical protein